MVRMLGFTLIETIITLTVMALAGTALVCSTSPSKTKMFLAVDASNRAVALQDCMNRIVSKHDALLRAGKSNVEEYLTAGSNGASDICPGFSVNPAANTEKSLSTTELSPTSSSGSVTISGRYLLVTVKDGSLELSYVLAN